MENFYPTKEKVIELNNLIKKTFEGKKFSSQSRLFLNKIIFEYCLNIKPNSERAKKLLDYYSEYDYSIHDYIYYNKSEEYLSITELLLVLTGIRFLVKIPRLYGYMSAAFASFVVVNVRHHKNELNYILRYKIHNYESQDNLTIYINDCLK